MIKNNPIHCRLLRLMMPTSGQSDPMADTHIHYLRL